MISPVIWMRFLSNMICCSTAPLVTDTLSGPFPTITGVKQDWNLREDIETVLEPNMVVSIEPMVMLPETLPGAGGYREHDILVVKEDGAENITKFPFGPEHNIIS